jgi:hypothetical protein
MATRPYLGVHYADRASVLSHKRQLIVLAARVIESADEAQSFVLSHDRPASSFQLVLKRDHSIDSLGRAIHHREAGNTFRGHQLGRAAAGAIRVDEELTIVLRSFPVMNVTFPGVVKIAQTSESHEI